MRRTLCVFLLVIVGVSANNGFAQQSQTDQTADREARGRIAAIYQQMRYAEGNKVDEDRYLRELPASTERVRIEIDTFIRQFVRPSESTQSIQLRLRNLLNIRPPNLEYADLPTVHMLDLPIGRILVLAYTIVRPPHFNSGNIRAYRATLNNFEFIAATGPEFGDDPSGFGLFTRPVPSPVPGEFWLLAWGENHTGKISLFRLYAFNGQQFRTVWSPETMPYAKITFTASGFSIRHLVRDTTPGYSVDDDYALTATGPFKTATRVVN
jgi:hypothetical protein